MRQLSTEGNPAAKPGLLAKAAAYNLGGLNDTRTRLGNLAFNNTGTQSQLGINIAGEQGDQYAGLARGLGNFLNTNPTPQYGLTIGGMKI